MIQNARCQECGYDNFYLLEDTHGVDMVECTWCHKRYALRSDSHTGLPFVDTTEVVEQTEEYEIEKRER